MRALVLTQRLPYAPNRGDRLRAFHQIRHLRADGWTVDILALAHDAEEQSHADAMRSEGHRVEVARIPHLRNMAGSMTTLLGEKPLTLSLLDSPALAPAVDRLLQGGSPDVVLAFSSSMAGIALRPPLSAYPLVLDLVDVDSEKWRALAGTSRWPMSWIYRREYRTLQAFEKQAARRAFATLVVNHRELTALRALAPEANVQVLPIGIDLQHFRRPLDTVVEPRVVFTGVMSYLPNAEAATWLAREVWPLVRGARPDAHLDLVGATPPAAVRRLGDTDAGILVTGSVPDVRPYLWRASVAAAPLHVARGVQTKVIEAAAAGLPCVVTPAVREGLPERLQDLCPVAEPADDFARAIVRHLEGPRFPEVWANAVADLDYRIALSGLPALLSNAARHGRQGH